MGTDDKAEQLTTDHKPDDNVERARILKSGGTVSMKNGTARVVWNRPKLSGKQMN